MTIKGRLLSSIKRFQAKNCENFPSPPRVTVNKNYTLCGKSKMLALLEGGKRLTVFNRLNTKSCVGIGRMGEIGIIALCMLTTREKNVEKDLSIRTAWNSHANIQSTNHPGVSLFRNH